ncbi:hypothetical protein SteCoe_14607 [Stentor coeruleus]|uniref:Sel1 repeat family protein n=1 Tax=Stentor coeruleus TaxID=5963 RepID=A0A1R2C5S1_9CILI|nr:hypothetical protein SteCoe_14607 [Stentor coeruleus]
MYDYVWNPKLANLCAKVPSHVISYISSKLYIGSKVLPKNQDLAFKILDNSLRSANDYESIQNLKFSKAYLSKIYSIESNNLQLLKDSNNTLMQMCRDEYPQALFVMGKELIMLKDTLKGLAGRASQERAKKFFEICVKNEYTPAYYYLGVIYQEGISVEKDLEKAVKLYEKGREYNDPQAVFKLAMIANGNGDKEQYYQLMKEAAEMGLMEAQHNLACYYLEKDEVVKALGWFLNAGKHDFYPSMINIGTIFLSGKGKILGNPLAAFIWFKRAQKIENSEQLEQLIEAAQREIDNLHKDKNP